MEGDRPDGVFFFFKKKFLLENRSTLWFQNNKIKKIKLSVLTKKKKKKNFSFEKLFPMPVYK
jgi:hypothetical protein